MQKVQFLKDLLASRTLLADGAMGTMIYQQGVFINTCFDELNVTNPRMIKNIHAAYVAAGSDIIETNTFGTNKYKLGRFGLADQVEKYIEAGVNLAKDAAGKGVLVAGSIGPLGVEITDYSPVSKKDAARAFADQAVVFDRAGADIVILETFSSSLELMIAIDAVADACELPIVAQITSQRAGETIYGESIGHAIGRIAENDAVAAVGLNCSLGPSEMLESLEFIKKITDKPVSIQPNAGMPRQVEGRTIYMCTPEYMSEYAKRFYENGVRIIGGCCGTTPEHIRQMVLAVKPLDKAQGVKRSFGAETLKVTTFEECRGVDSVPFEQRSRIAKKISEHETVEMIEITPPRGVDVTATVEKARICEKFGIDAINLPDGPRASSRLSPLITALKIQEMTDMETVLHFCCRDRNLLAMQSDMLGASAAGIKNMLLVTGDPPKMGEYPDATGVFDLDSIALTSVLRNLNHGLDIGGKTFNPPTALTIGVGANPVAADIGRENERFKRKVEAGAEYAITQPVFDVESYFNFLEAVEDCKIPIIAGIWPFTSYKNAEFMANEVPGVVVPDELLKKMAEPQTKSHARAVGIEIARDMIEKIKDHVAGFAVSAPFGNVNIALAVLSKIDIEEI
jgi:homocysteine S-methyltransferase